jgi:hypothetical protein
MTFDSTHGDNDWLVARLSSSIVDRGHHIVAARLEPAGRGELVSLHFHPGWRC